MIHTERLGQSSTFRKNVILPFLFANYTLQSECQFQYEHTKTDYLLGSILIEFSMTEQVKDYLLI